MLGAALQIHLNLIDFQSCHGFDRTLTLVSTRREDELEQHPTSDSTSVTRLVDTPSSCTFSN